MFRFVFFFFSFRTARWIHMIQFLNCLLSLTPNKPGQPSTIRKIFVFNFQPLKDVVDRGRARKRGTLIKTTNNLRFLEYGLPFPN